MKKSLIILVFILFSTNLFSQNCGTGPTNFDNDLCWLKNFVRPQLGIPNEKTELYQTYNYGSSTHALINDNAPWGGNYFSWKNGGLCTRWGAFNQEPKYPVSNKLDYNKVKTLTTDQIARLSPAEKLDIYLGYTDFRITKHELLNRGPETSNIFAWEGFCNGLRAAGALTPEPTKTISVKSPDGKEVKFFPADLKILVGATYFYLENFGYGQVGSNNSVAPNAGVFDIALRLLVGDKDKVFFFDSNQSEQIWNHSVVGYNRVIVEDIRPARQGDTLPNGANKVVSYKLTLYHMGEISLEDMNSPTRPRISNLSSCCVEQEVYNYTLYLDVNNKIVEGKWLNNLYPDAVWFANGRGDDQNHSPSLGIDPNTGKTYRGNANLSFDKILELIKLSAN